MRFSFLFLLLLLKGSLTAQAQDFCGPLYRTMLGIAGNYRQTIDASAENPITPLLFGQSVKKEEGFPLKDSITALGEQFMVARDKMPMVICNVGCYKKTEEAAGWMEGFSETLQAFGKAKNRKTEQSGTSITRLFRVHTPVAEVMVACCIFQQDDCMSLTVMMMDARNFLLWA